MQGADMATHFLDDREGGHAASGIASSCELISDAPLAGHISSVLEILYLLHTVRVMWYNTPVPTCGAMAGPERTSLGIILFVGQ